MGQLEIDPFESPWRPLGASGPAAAPAPVASEAPTAPSLPPPEQVSDLRCAVAAYEKRILEAALERHRHNQRRTASALGLSYDQLRHALKRHGLLGE